MRDLLKAFQSTHPQGVRLLKDGDTPQSRSFNPRTRKGCDAGFIPAFFFSHPFQSTHPQGVRLEMVDL